MDIILIVILVAGFKIIDRIRWYLYQRPSSDIDTDKMILDWRASTAQTKRNLMNGKYDKDK